LLSQTILAALLCVPAFAAGPTPTLDEALNHLYNFQFPAAQQTVDKIVAANPQDPLPYAFRAAGYLFYELDRLGALEAEFLSTDTWAYDKKKKVPDPAVRASMETALRDAETRGQAALKSDPNDRNALFALTIAGGVTADYMALIDKRQFGSLAPSKVSNNYAQRLLKLDPKFYDAYLTAGFSEYVVGSLPFFVKWFVHWDNVAGSKEQGKKNLETAAREGHYFKAFARILLSIVYLREKRPADAQKLLAELAHDYPANQLFRKELAKLNQKLGIAAN
jgi:tetratricopeptide (TPR) repeat protein